MFHSQETEDLKVDLNYDTISSLSAFSLFYKLLDIPVAQQL